MNEQEKERKKEEEEDGRGGVNKNERAGERKKEEEEDGQSIYRSFPWTWKRTTVPATVLSWPWPLVHRLSWGICLVSDLDTNSDLVLRVHGTMAREQSDYEHGSQGCAAVLWRKMTPPPPPPKKREKKEKKKR